MENYIGKICPHCQAEIKEEDAVVVCPACGIPHHKSCWEEKGGCAATGCPEHRTAEPEVQPACFCSSCGAQLADDQMFCHKCGASRNSAKKKVCLKCGAELQDDQAFCPKCGQQAGIPAPMPVPGKKSRLPVILGIIAGVVILAAVLIFVLSGGNKPDFNKMYGSLAFERWCEIASDGTWMKLDTNPDDIDSDDLKVSDYTTIMIPCDEKIEQINTELGFSTSLYEKMNTTTWSQGRQTERNENYTVTWTYHPDKGLEVLYEVN